jgi:hypothetical protein
MINTTIQNLVPCKLAFNGQNRRFSFCGTEFTQLCEQIGTLIGLPVNGFVLKYVDNENDLVTLKTNEELALALAISEKVLRLKAEGISVSGPVSGPVSPGDCAGGRHRGHPGHGPHGNYGHHRGHPGHGPHGHHGHPGYGHGRIQKGDRISKCDPEKKIELLKGFLSQMPPDESLTPALALRKAHLRQKIQKLESRRAHWSDREENGKRRKWEKKCKKDHKKKHRKDHKKHQNMSPEVCQQVYQLKLQIIALRPELCQLRLQKKQKKLELSNFLQTGCGDKETIWQEILDLKVKISQAKSQIQPLKQSVKDLKASKQ